MCESDEHKPEQIREDRYRTEAQAVAPALQPRLSQWTRSSCFAWKAAVLKRYSKAMSQQNVEVVRRHYEAFDRRQFNAAVEGWDPTGEWTPAIAGAVEGKVYIGTEGFREYFQE